MRHKPFGLDIVRFVYRLLIFVGLSLGCSPENRAVFYPAGQLSVEAGVVDFRETEFGTIAESFVGIANLGTEMMVVDLSVLPDDVGFSLAQDVISIGRNASADAKLLYAPLPENSEATAWLSIVVRDEGRGPIRVELVGSAHPDVDGDGQMDVRLGGDDCNDRDARIYLGAAEVWYDGVDQNCDEKSDFDQDGDGFEREPEGLDCDDRDALVFPGQFDMGAASEKIGRDDDCDGSIDEDAVATGDLVVSELFPLPNQIQAAYFEIANVSDRVIYLDGWNVTINGSKFELPDGHEIGVGGYFLFCDDAVLAKEWGCDFEWSPSVRFGAASGSVVVSSPTLLVDSVKWNALWDFQPSVGLELSASMQSADENDQSDNWCASITDLDGGGYGSPGQANAQCPAGLY